HNDAYFGLGGTMDTDARAEYMSQDLLMLEIDSNVQPGGAVNASPTHAAHPPMEIQGGFN
ncbi:MAG: hypothetical protein L7S56_02645, partial [Candidatus Poseidonia sp.]|nr:hypothetical protein [Poseidonia sp.]